MDPTTVRRPNLVCPARGHVGKATIGIHSRKGQRCICTPCRRRSHSDGVLYTTSSERLPAIGRERLALLTHHGRALAR